MERNKNAVKHIVIGIKSSHVDNIYQLPPRLNIDGVDVLIHHDPTVRLQDNCFVCNCDIAVELTIPGMKGDEYLKSALGDHYHHIPRLKKNAQYIKLLAAQFLNPNGPLEVLKLPAHLTTNTTKADMRPIDEMGSSFGFEAGQRIGRVVVKPENGARGKGQALVPIDELRSFFNDIDLPYSELKEKHPNVHFSEPDPNNQEHEKEDRLKLANVGPWVISEYVENIVAEYRVIVSGDRFYIAERERSEGEFPQANIDLEHAVAKRNFSEVEPTQVLHPALKEIAEIFNLRIGSIDLFETSDGKFGFFECCPQFGMNAMSHDEAFNFHYGFVKWLVKNYQ